VSVLDLVVQAAQQAATLRSRPGTAEYLESRQVAEHSAIAAHFVPEPMRRWLSCNIQEQTKQVCAAYIPDSGHADREKLSVRASMPARFIEKCEADQAGEAAILARVGQSLLRGDISELSGVDSEANS
jgi:hypothetical protein